MNILVHLDRNKSGEFTWIGESEAPGYVVFAETLEDLKGLAKEALEEFFPEEGLIFTLEEPTLEFWNE